jgi:phosphoglucosamine mutase
VERTNEELGDQGRVLVRPSGTESLVRVLAEAPGEEESEALCARVAALVNDELGAVASSAGSGESAGLL